MYRPVCLITFAFYINVANQMNVKHNRDAVLKTGLSLLCNKGYHSLGVDEICKVTGMTKGAFYNAFKSKEQFLYEATLLYSELNIKRIQAELLPKSGQTSYDRLLTFYIKMFEAQPRLNYTGCFINNMMAEVGYTSELMGQATKIEFDRFIDAILPTVVEAQQDGYLTPYIEARALTELIHSTFYGLLTIAKSSKDFNHSIQTIKLLFQNIKYK